MDAGGLFPDGSATDAEAANAHSDIHRYGLNIIIALMAQPGDDGQ